MRCTSEVAVCTRARIGSMPLLGVEILCRSKLNVESEHLSREIFSTGIGRLAPAPQMHCHYISWNTLPSCSIGNDKPWPSHLVTFVTR